MEKIEILGDHYNYDAVIKMETFNADARSSVVRGMTEEEDNAV